MRIALILPFLLTAAAAGTTAIAALPQEDSQPASDRDAQLYMAEFASCVVAEKPYRPRVDAFLRTMPGSPGFGDAALKAADLHCLDAAAARTHSKITMRMQPVVFRESLYPALYKREFAKSGPVSAIRSAPPARLSAEFDGDIATLPLDYRSRRVIADCVVRATPQGAHAMILSQPSSPSEDAALEMLKPAIAACLPQSMTLHMNRPAIRAFVAEAAYKLAHGVPATS